MDFSYPGGESKREHLIKARGRLEHFYNMSTKNRIGVATLSGALQRLIYTCVNAPIEKIDLSNFVVYCISFNGSEWTFKGKI